MKKLGRLFLQGFLAILPVALTLYVLYWLAVSAESLLGGAIKYIVGDNLYLPGLGVLSGFLLILGVGLLLEEAVKGGTERLELVEITAE